MSSNKGNGSGEFEKALDIGRPPNIVQLFPNSKALIVGGKVMDRAMIKKGRAMTIASNCRNKLVIGGPLWTVQRANPPIIVEMAKSEGGNACYPIIYWNLTRRVAARINELGIAVTMSNDAVHSFIGTGIFLQGQALSSFR